MLRITMELVPYGDEDLAATIATAELWNMGRMNADMTEGDYGYRIEGDWEHYNQSTSTKVFETGVVRRFPRAKGGAWALLREALVQAIPSLRVNEDY